MRSEILNDNYHKHRELLSYTKYQPEAIPGETEILLRCSRAFIRSAYIDSQMSGRARKRNASTEASHQPAHPNIYPVVRLRLRARKYRSLVPNVRLFMEANRTSPVQPQALEAMIRVAVIRGTLPCALLAAIFTRSGWYSAVIRPSLVLHFCYPSSAYVHCSHLIFLHHTLFTASFIPQIARAASMPIQGCIVRLYLSVLH